jgi:two-component system NtrC family sensor kinase
VKSLRARLGISAALVVALVVSLSTYMQSRIVSRAVEAESLDAAEAVALGVAADLGEHTTTPTAAELADLLADYRKAVPAVHSLTITAGPTGATSVLASTEAAPPARIRVLAEEAVSRREIATFADGPLGLHFAAVALPRHTNPPGAVIVAVRMDALQRVQRQSRQAALVLGSAAILLLAAGLDIVARRLVHQPLGAVLATMSRASAGDLRARAPRTRADEIGAVAENLNSMLDRMEGFNDTLRAEVETATADLRAANRELLETAQRLFAVRRALAESQRLALAGEMAASVAHQVGTPLNVMSGYVQMLRAGEPEGSPAARRLETVQQQIARVTAIVQSLLDKTRRPPLELAPVAPGAALERLAELVRPTLVPARIELSVAVEPALPHLAADPGQLEQALLHLVTNAIDAMPDGGRLELAARRDGRDVVLSVADSGTGIPAEDLARVFEPLYTTKPRGRGTGLGLPIVREIVAAHGGTVSLESDPGGGTTALVRVPAAPEEGG